ncbi:hypothetical protein [Kribbella karoonensis]|uniref:Uncharacterized protein n=1 Tax=Kribbella karoonensis TaxID=324851 RepID=A0ABN2DTG0_9ACTN|nr:hypothetical protein [Kribbella sp.]
MTNEEDARAVLADWLARRSLAPDNWTADALRQWDCTQQDEWLAFVPPGSANRVFLVDDRTVYDYAPSESSLADAIAAARASRP